MVDTKSRGNGTVVEEEEGVLAASHSAEVAGDSLVMEGSEEAAVAATVGAVVEVMEADVIAVVDQ